MKKLATLCLLLATFVAFAPSAMAVMTNKGVDAPLPTTPNDLTPDDGRANGRILYAPSEADDPALRAAIAAASGGIVDYYDASAGTPDAAEAAKEARQLLEQMGAPNLLARLDQVSGIPASS